eukprot:Gb_29297 [translate_table: standard]
MGKMGASLGHGTRVWLLILCAVFMLSTVIHGLRPLRKDSIGSHSRASLTSFSEDELMKNTLANEEEMAQMEIDCDNLDEEECMNRRDLAAHTDYIYTQQHGKP